MSAPAKPWETHGEVNDSLRLRQNQRIGGVPNSRPNMFGEGMHSSSPAQAVPTVPQGSVRRRSGAVPPVPPPAGRTLVRGGQGYMPAMAGYASPSQLGMYGGTSGYGTTGYGGYGATGYGATGYGATGYGATGYGSYGTGSYGGYGSLGSLGYGQRTYGAAGGYGMNRFPPGPGMSNLESRFIQLAEEGSRPAFESIESVVQTFGSINFMLESTFGAIYSSFRAVLGVAENFGRLRSLFGQVFSTFAVLRAFQWMYRKLLYYLGLRSDNPGQESIWQHASGDPSKRTFWPVALFIGIVCSGPYLVWKLLNSLSVGLPSDNADLANTASAAAICKSWASSGEPRFVAVAKYDFVGRCPTELSVNANSHLYLAPQSFQPTNATEWVLAFDGRKNVGLVPKTYVSILNSCWGNSQSAHLAPPQLPGPSLLSEMEPIPFIPFTPVMQSSGGVYSETNGTWPDAEVTSQMQTNKSAIPQNNDPIIITDDKACSK